ncbi:MAG TPA: 1-acyl-sn-glycerol-3-phosphate acyltransferase [Candidatus Odoribacter faecigallinarum]|uniref:1-acyl-sn-glycerol-3-phosphate acyltransferase n=1 Tax=Candidatus Odoribacter faecigallinarum TaxID=2838706 RepID=A0A9D1UY63_9BACT|nr:1-acyl-sn-glycerol-3-phosphate acyltransferase [Candidatus Odoribacter faecigallinarum]
MTSNPEFDSIRPYYDSEVPAAAERLCQSEAFLDLFKQLFKLDKAPIIAMLKKIKTKDQFQQYLFGPIVRKLMDMTTDGVTIEGIELIDNNASYTFMSNHRDIILDSAILNVLLREHGAKYTRPAIGSNLLINDWVTDFVKLDSCFVVERDITVREMISSSSLRSQYIRETIQENEYSVWIAEKEGRTKNGDDRVQQALLKMLKISGPANFAENFKELHLMPLAISYEWEPCDALKTQELYTRSVGEYTKTPEADMNSMITGLKDYKGRIHFHMDQLKDAELDEIDNLPSNNDKIEALANLIDSKIHKNYKLWPNNYIAYDLLHSVNKFNKYYTPEEKENFIRVMTQKIDKLEGNVSLLNNIFLEIYANPVKNHLKL